MPLDHAPSSVRKDVRPPYPLNPKKTYRYPFRNSEKNIVSHPFPNTSMVGLSSDHNQHLLKQRLVLIFKALARDPNVAEDGFKDNNASDSQRIY